MNRSLVGWVLGALLASPAEPPPYGLPLEGEAAEAFLRAARVTEMRQIGTGITHPEKATLTDGQRTLHGVFKTIDVNRPGLTEFDHGRAEVDFRDSYKFEIAAYELDKLLGLRLVPPTVERELDGRKGSLQLWVEGAMTEWDRQKKKLPAPDPDRWNQQMYKVRLLHQLTFNTDRGNIRNVLIDPGFRIYAIDHSRAFRRYDQLPGGEKDLTHFSRAALEKLRTLDAPLLKAKLGGWLTGPELNALLKRRDLILVLAERRVREQGEDAVLYP
ncbi:MAG TPA: hypothetical protein VGL15_07285 [Vicinamibacteria bacterium]